MHVPPSSHDHPLLKPTSTQLTQPRLKNSSSPKNRMHSPHQLPNLGPVHSTPGARQQEIFPIATAVMRSSRNIPDISNFASNTFGGFFGNSNNASPHSLGRPRKNSRQVTYPQDSQPFPSGDSRALMNGQPNAPLPHPTQLPNSAGGSSKSPSPSTNNNHIIKVPKLRL
ncbi:hypothetical protein PGT21_000441 [Puccinia graminis f. sp. tritici]|uniref:Uncharacterized protein n=1 Tax=Puccinia graminis f. sp. tritici TaxID=56615 RepID=A0A5B0P1Q8_PUCGR|nr:hypothetical protein PGT21_000441 [Puccinia graminis f. sp. tritici]